MKFMQKRVGAVDRVTLTMLAKGVTLVKLVSSLKSRFPYSSVEKHYDHTCRRLSWYLEYKYDVKVIKDKETGKYYITR